MNNLVFLTIITGRRKKEGIIKMLNVENAQLIEINYTRDYVAANPICYAFGLCRDEDEVLIKSLLTEDNADKALEKLYNEFNFKKPKTGIAFTVKIDATTV